MAWGVLAARLGVGVLSFTGTNDDSDVQIEAAIWPLAELSLARMGVESPDYDPAARQVTRWTRRVTFKVGGEELQFDVI